MEKVTPSLLLATRHGRRRHPRSVGGVMGWRARSASDKTNDWPLWYVTDDIPADRNKTMDAFELIGIQRPAGLPFVSKIIAEAVVKSIDAIKGTSK